MDTIHNLLAYSQALVGKVFVCLELRLLINLPNPQSYQLLVRVGRRLPEFVSTVPVAKCINFNLLNMTKITQIF